MSYLGENIRKYRKLKGLTLNELAKISKSSISSISQIETGKRDATFQMILGLAQALEIDITVLVRPPSETKFKHIIDFVIHFNDFTILIGNSKSDAEDKCKWAIIADLSNGKTSEILYFYSNCLTIDEKSFCNIELNSYYMEQRLRILLRRDMVIDKKFNEIKSIGITWEEFKHFLKLNQKI